jgi:hypothetical protein
MAKAGFECEVTDDGICVTKDGKPFEVKMWDVPGWGNRRVHFNLNFTFEDMDKVKPKGLMLLTSECNNHNEYSTTRFWGDHFSCCVETMVRSAKEFVREFGFAYKQIGNTYKGLAANYTYIKEMYMMQPECRPIGFLADRYLAEKEKAYASKRVARKDYVFG